ncbi:MAG TPA: hypothetical protein VFE46_02515 [Pirellulales bacterium]|jgi:hypothetical protein|nr:hypothetical protein [Pirellulales bacterium]
MHHEKWEAALPAATFSSRILQTELRFRFGKKSIEAIAIHFARDCLFQQRRSAEISGGQLSPQ